MITKTAHAIDLRSHDPVSDSSPLIRATSLRGLPVCRGTAVLGRVQEMTYDHAARRVTGLLMTGRDQCKVQAIPLDELNLLTSPYHPLQVSMVRPWPAPRPGNPPVDTLRLHAPSGVGIAYLHDAWFGATTGRIHAYEVGLLPRQAASAPTLRVPAELVTFDEASRGTLAPQLFEALSSVLRAGVRFPPLQPQARAVCA